MEKNLEREKFIFDTSALISLSLVDLIEKVLESINVVVIGSVIRELEEFAKFDDEYGKASKKVLRCKDRFILEEIEVTDRISFIQETDNELYNLAKKKLLILITDDIKFYRHVCDQVAVQFRTYFISALVFSGGLSREKAFGILDKLREGRGWEDNLIFLRGDTIIFISPSKGSG